MTIPEKLKIGAKVYCVEITNKLDLGNVNYSGEISYTDLVIRICPNAQAKMEADFLHEMIHGMLDHLGYTEHDEKKVDELANALQVCLDSGAKKVLLPITSAADLGLVPADLIGCFNLVFYQSAEDAVYKALGVE